MLVSSKLGVPQAPALRRAALGAAGWLERRNPRYVFVGYMIALFGGLVAIGVVPELADGKLYALVPLAVGGAGFAFGALVLYGFHLRRG